MVHTLKWLMKNIDTTNNQNKILFSRNINCHVFHHLNVIFKKC